MSSGIEGMSFAENPEESALIDGAAVNPLTGAIPIVPSGIAYPEAGLPPEAYVEPLLTGAIPVVAEPAPLTGAIPVAAETAPISLPEAECRRPALAYAGGRAAARPGSTTVPGRRRW